MIEREYHEMAKLQNSFWWHKGSEKIFNSVLKGKRFKSVLNAGSGTGRLSGKFGPTTNMDMHEKALEYCEKAGLKTKRGNLNKIPFKEEFSLVLATDVLYHKGVNIPRALRELNRVLKPGGTILVNDPAFEFLTSSHDVAMQTQKRFTRPELVKEIENAGFKIKKATYWNFFLFPLIALMRLLKRGSSGKESDIKEINPLINSILYFILVIESKLIRFVNFPFGVSVCVLAEKVKSKR